MKAGLSSQNGRIANPVIAENCLPGTPQSTWDVSGAGDATLQGFATQMSVNAGETIHFKISTTAAAFHVDIYRIGWYQGDGARLVASRLSLQKCNPLCHFAR